jgi:hypothetical protein
MTWAARFGVDDAIHVADGGVRQWEALGHPVERPD